MMAAKAFVDTNILLRALSPRLAFHKESVELIMEMWEANIELWVSRQILREYLVQATHPKTFTPALSIVDVAEQIETIQALFQIADETQAVTEQLLMLLKMYPTLGKQVHDANIVATMLAYEIDTLLTMNIADFKRFAGPIRLISIGAII